MRFTGDCNAPALARRPVSRPSKVLRFEALDDQCWQYYAAMFTHRFVGAAAAVVVFLWHSCASGPFGSPLIAQGRPESWRPTLVAQHGMVAAGHPLAAEAGLRI